MIVMILFSSCATLGGMCRAGSGFRAVSGEAPAPADGSGVFGWLFSIVNIVSGKAPCTPDFQAGQKPVFSGLRRAISSVIFIFLFNETGCSEAGHWKGE